ncbi:hypothetical protein CHS0354_018397 [Potamilus streckersoni]|uniref:TIR domain-containing protein n=1 Tax=Potamilus streckersoni TaxID=2493646 RepID=A0AAE0TBN9_9BIVA|nr:hypothetical protein CHS0354_018397 [Potamilus streckersoni]
MYFRYILRLFILRKNDWEQGLQTRISKRTAAAPLTLGHRPAHIDWVGTLYEGLKANGIDVLWDQKVVELGYSLNYFMQKMTDPKTDYVLMICDREYTRKSNLNRPTPKTGVEIETQIIKNELMANMESGRIIPLTVQLTPKGEPSRPNVLKIHNTKHLDFYNQEKINAGWETLLNHIYSKPKHSRPAAFTPAPAFVFPAPADTPADQPLVLSLAELAYTGGAGAGYRRVPR